MKIAPRLARPAAAAALAAAALAIPATSASASTDQQACRAEMADVASYEMMWSVRYMLAGDLANFQRTAGAVSDAATAYGKC